MTNHLHVLPERKKMQKCQAFSTSGCQLQHCNPKISFGISFKTLLMCSTRFVNLRACILLAILFKGSFVFAQKSNFQSAHVFGDSAHTSIIFDVIHDSSGNYYTAGTFTDPSIQLDPDSVLSPFTNVGGSDFFLQKFNHQGKLLWAKHWGSTKNDAINGICTDANENVVLIGKFNDSMDLNPGLGRDLHMPHGPLADVNASFMIKLDSNGNYLWGNSIENDASPFNQLDIDNYGNIYTTGQFLGTIDIDPSPNKQLFKNNNSGRNNIILSKFNAKGKLVWANHLKGTGKEHYVVSISVNQIGQVLIFGSFAGTIDLYDNTTKHQITSSGYSQIGFLARYTAKGVLTWSGLYKAKVRVEPTDAILNNSGHMYVTGAFIDSLDIDPSPAKKMIYANQQIDFSDAFMSKLDSNGRLVHSFVYSSPSNTHIWGLQLDENENIHACGIFSGTMDFDPGPRKYWYSGTFSAFYLRLDSSLNYLKTWVFNNYQSGTLSANCSYHNGQVIIAGLMRGKMDLDPGWGNYIVRVVSGYGQFYGRAVIVRMNPCDGLIHFKQKKLPDIVSQCPITHVAKPMAITDCGDTLYGQLNAQLPMTAEGTQEVTWSFTSAGRIIYQKQNLIYNVTIAPTPVGNLADSLFSHCAIDTLYPTMAIDNCGDTVYATTQTVFPLSRGQKGSIKWLFDDGNGNSTQASQYYEIDSFNTSYRIDTGKSITAIQPNVDYQWYNCHNIWTPISGAVGQKFSPDSTGYYLAIIEKDDCKDTLDCIFFDVTTIGNSTPIEISFDVFPNPAQNTIQLQSEDFQFGDIQVSDIQGKMLPVNYLNKTERNVVLDVSNYSPGMYIITVNRGVNQLIEITR